MDLRRCERGHFYDREKYSTCPHCVSGINGGDISGVNESDNGRDISSIDWKDNQSNMMQKKSSRSVGKKICLNLSKWIVETVLFSLIPLFFYMLIHWMFQFEETSLDKYIGELCPFTLVISSSIAIELAKKKYVDTNIKEVIFPAYLILLILFFMLYGATIVSLELKIPLKKNILDKIFLVVLLISGIHLMIGASLQILGGFYDE